MAARYYCWRVSLYATFQQRIQVNGGQKRKEKEIRRRLDKLEVMYLSKGGHIIPMMVGDPIKCQFISDLLLTEYGISIRLIKY